MTAALDLDAAIRGDRHAREALVQAHGRRVFGMCRRLDPTPEDAYQEIWEKVFKGLARFDTRTGPPLQAWITTVARRHLIDRHRRRSARGEIVPLDGDVSVEPEAEGLADRVRLRERLESALASLPEAQRFVVVQHHVHGCELQVLATESGLPVGTLKSRLHRGRARLAEILRRST